MNSRRVGIVLAASLSLACGAQPLVAGAQGPVPVQIGTCAVLQYQPARPAYRSLYWYDYGFAGPLVPNGSPFTDGIRISFTNTSAMVADRVVFGVNYRGDFERVIDAGTFSPNARIDHTFADVFSGYAYLGPRPNACSVRVVRFKDGSIWRAPGVGPRRQTR
ncbi:MAG: hypothetical protein ABSB70_09885 [Candidatus Velthaea sp.]|jgi:hypothetical protein